MRIKNPLVTSICVGRNGFEIMNNNVNTFFFESEGKETFFIFLILNGFLLHEFFYYLSWEKRFLIGKIKEKYRAGNPTQHTFFTFQTYLHTFQHFFFPTRISKTPKIPYSNLVTKRAHNIYDIYFRNIFITNFI